MSARTCSFQRARTHTHTHTAGAPRVGSQRGAEEILSAAAAEARGVVVGRRGMAGGRALAALALPARELELGEVAPGEAAAARTP